MWQCIKVGFAEMIRFCQTNDIPLKTCGKVIIATDQSELFQLQELYLRGKRSGIPCELMGPARLKEIEPHAQGLAALHIKSTAILNYRLVCDKLLALLAQKGCYVMLNTEVLSIKEMPTETLILTNHGRHYARYLINCSGLHADRILHMAGKKTDVKIISFRGDFYRLRDEVTDLCKAIIYPVPIPGLAPLGAHFTRGIDGSVECGPAAALALAREAYHRSQINPKYLLGILAFSGFWWLLGEYWTTGVAETWRASNKDAFVKKLQKLIPEIKNNQLIKAPSALRAQAVSLDGKLLQDLIVKESHRVVHVLNAQSPSATACFSIAKIIIHKLSKRFN